jgi:hypothetical protein
MNADDVEGKLNIDHPVSSLHPEDPAIFIVPALGAFNNSR